MQDATYCALLQDDDFGAEVEGGFEFATDKLGLETGVAVRYPSGHQDFTPQISRLKSADCDVVDLGGAGAVMQNAAVRSVQLNFDAQWIATNTAYNSSLATGAAADYIMENVLFFVTGTEWGDHSVKGQAMMEEDLAEIAPDHKPMANSYQTGYMAAIATTAILEQAIADGDLSREHLQEVAASELGTVDYFGLGGGEFEYGDSLAERVPPYGISAFTVDPDAATGLKLQKFGYKSDVAQAYNQAQLAE